MGLHETKARLWFCAGDIALPKGSTAPVGIASQTPINEFCKNQSEPLVSFGSRRALNLKKTPLTGFRR
jgi:hypothetical protein